MSYLPRPLLLACALASTSAFAADTITFEGEITDQTCSVKIDGHENATVKLPTYSVNAFKDDASFAGQTAFTMELSGCDANSNSKKAQLEFSSFNTTQDGNLKNIADTSAAEGIAVQLIEDAAAKTAIKFNETRANVALSSEFEAKDGAQKTFYARYTKEGSKEGTGEVKAGAVKATAQYTLVYL